MKDSIYLSLKWGETFKHPAEWCLTWLPLSQVQVRHQRNLGITRDGVRAEAGGSARRSVVLLQ